MYRDKVPFNKAGKVSHEKDTFAQKDSHLRTLQSELEKGRVVRNIKRGGTTSTENSNNIGSNNFPAKALLGRVDKEPKD